MIRWLRYKRLALCVVVLATLWRPAATRGQQSQPSSAQPTSQPATLPAATALSPDRLFEFASPAVVELSIRDDDGRVIASASAFVIQSEKAKYPQDGRDAYNVQLVTNYHVIRAAVSIEFLFTNGENGSVDEILAEDESADLAVLSAANQSFKEPARALRLHEGPNPPVGTKVYAIGSPLGLSNTLSEGLISGYRTLHEDQRTIQVTAPISPGSSGGPLLSSRGLVLGVVTATITDGQNLNFAIPAGEVVRLLSGPQKARKVWEGASLSMALITEEISAIRAMHSQFDRDHQQGIHTDQYPALFEEYKRKKEQEGDQLALLIKGWELSYDKNYDEAIETLKHAAGAKPGNYAFLAHFLLSKALMQKSDTDGIIEALRRAKALNPSFAPAIHWLGQMYSATGKYPEALLEADAAVRLLPRCYQAYQLRGEVWAQLGREEAFEKDFAIACDLRPSDAGLLTSKGASYTQLDKWDRAVQLYNQAIALDEKCFGAHVNLAIAYQEMRQFAKAIECLQRARRLFGQVEGSAMQDFDRRIEECRSHLAISP